MPVPVIDLDNLVIQEIPQSHRTPKFIAWFKGIVRGSIYWLNKRFYSYCFGDGISSLWDNTLTYSVDATVVNFQGVFISLQDNNLNNDPKNDTQDDINNPPIWWYKISPSYIGADERSNYSAQKIVMEYALNRYFRKTFKQPVAIDSGGYIPLSDIYIKTVDVVYASFQSFTRSAGSSTSYTNNSGANFVFTNGVNILDTTYQFIVYIPTALATLLGDSYEQIIRSKVDTISIIGVSYTIVLY